MNALILALGLLLPATVTKAAPAPYRGNFIVCSNEEDTLKMTADLSNGKGEKVATAVLNGVKKIFPESPSGRGGYTFAFYPSKKTPLLVNLRGQRDAEIRLNVDLEHPERTLIHDTTYPLVYKMQKYKAFLSVRSFKVSERPVTCTESKWESD